MTTRHNFRDHARLTFCLLRFPSGPAVCLDFFRLWLNLVLCWSCALLAGGLWSFRCFVLLDWQFAQLRAARSRSISGILGDGHARGVSIWNEKRRKRMNENVRSIIGPLTRLLYDILGTRRRSGHLCQSSTFRSYKLQLLLVFVSSLPLQNHFQELTANATQRYACQLCINSTSRQLWLVYDGRTRRTTCA